MTGVELAVEMLSWLAIVGGCIFVVIGSAGIVRFPDFWSRLHAASVVDSAGVILLIIGMCLQAGPNLITVKLLIIGLFLFITGPTATHAVANAALVSGLLPTGEKKKQKALEKQRSVKAVPVKSPRKKKARKS